MLISDEQQEANRQNASHSTGPKTPEGKAAVRLNALTYGLRARCILIPGENPADYQQLWADLEAEWQPQTRTERLYLEQMATSQWLLARVATGESNIYQQETSAEKQSALLDRVSTQRARLERSFTSARRELEHLQPRRPAQRQQPQPKQTVESAQPAAPHPALRMMSEGPEDHPAFCSPVTPDSR